MSNKYDIFISHSKEDNKLAVALCHFLEERQFRCWMAPRDVQAGADYAKCIIEGIQSSSVMVVILSEYSNRSNHVRNEVERAFNHQVAILPFRIRDVIPAQSLEYFLSSYHWLDAVDGQAENYFEDLHRHCMALLRSGEPLPKPIPKPDPVPTPVPKPVPPPVPPPVDLWYKKPVNLAAGGVVVLLLLFFFVIKPLFDKNTIEFKNTLETPIYLDFENGKSQTIPALSSYNYEGRKNSRVKIKGHTYIVTSTGAILGTRIEWNLDTIVHADGNYILPLDVRSDYFFLKIANSGNSDVNYIRVNGNNQFEKIEFKTQVPHDGKTYLLGYYKILPGTTIEAWNTDNRYLKWTNGSNLRFNGMYNDVVTIPFQ